MSEIVNDSEDKREIISLLDSIIESYNTINMKLKSTKDGNYVFSSRTIYGAMRKDVSSSIYHANTQKKWVITESD